MAEFHYAKIIFCLDEVTPEDSIPVAILAEWYDGDFWKTALIAANKMRKEDFDKLDDFSKTFFDSPFVILNLMLDHHIKKTGWRQNRHILGSILDRLFTSQTNLHAEFLFKHTIAIGENPEETLEELSSCIPGSLKYSFWNRLDPTDVTSIDKTRLLEDLQ